MKETPRPSGCHRGQLGGSRDRVRAPRPPAAAGARPAGEPTIPGVEYASGLGAPYLTTAGAPRKLAGVGIGALGGKLAGRRGQGRHQRRQGRRQEGQAPRPSRSGTSTSSAASSPPTAPTTRCASRSRASASPTTTGSTATAQGDPTKWATCGNSLHRPERRRDRPDRHRPLDDPVGRAGREGEEHPDRRLLRHRRPRLRGRSSPRTRSSNGQILAKYLKAKLGSQPAANIVLDRLPGAVGAGSDDAAEGARRQDARAEDRRRRRRPNPANLIAGTQKDVTRRPHRQPGHQGDLGRLRHRRRSRPARRARAASTRARRSRTSRCVVTFHADPSTQVADDGAAAIDAVIDNNYDATAWEVADAAAQFFVAQEGVPEVRDQLQVPGHRRSARVRDRDAEEPAAGRPASTSPRRSTWSPTSPRSGRHRASRK